MHRCAAVAAAVLVLTAVTTGSPADTAVAHARGAEAAVRVVRFTSANAAVTVRFVGYAGGAQAISVPAGTGPAAAGYAALPPGQYVVTVRSALPVPGPVTVRVKPGAAYTMGMLVGAGTMRAIFVHDGGSVPPSGSGRVRIVQAAAGASHAVVALRHGPVLAAHARFGTVTRYRTVRAGTWRVTASAAKRVSGVAPHTAGRLHTATDVPVRSGHLLTLVVADASSGGGLSVRTLADVAASDRAPAGAVPAGGGGMATTPVDHPGAPSGPVTGVLALLGAIALWAGLRRVRAVHRRRTAVPRGSS